MNIHATSTQANQHSTTFFIFAFNSLLFSCQNISRYTAIQMLKTVLDRLNGMFSLKLISVAYDERGDDGGVCLDSHKQLLVI